MPKGDNPNSKKNLKPNTRANRTKKEQSEIARKGGKKSGEVRRARKTFAEEFLAALSNGDVQSSITMSMLEKAMKGDTKAFEVIRDTIGEKPVERVKTEAVVDVATMNVSLLDALDEVKNGK